MDLSVATNMLGQGYENTLGPEDATAPGLGLAGLGIVPAGAQKVFSSNEFPSLVVQSADAVSGTYEVKLEGMAIVDDRTILLANDNGFGIVDPLLHSTVWTVTLNNKLHR